MIPIYKPYISKYTTSALASIKDEWISNHGIYIELASNKLSEILNIKYCILMNNGTAATQCLYKALKYKYPHITKIYIPNNVFVAPYNCGLLEYPSEIFEVMDINLASMNIPTNIEYITTLDANSAVIIVHNLGNIINVPRLKLLRPDIIFIEDNCEGLFGRYENQYSGSAAFCSSVSFYGNKTITTGEGGAFLTDDINVYNYIKNIYSHGMSEERYIHNNLGHNFRMTNIQAGFLFDQLNDYKHILNLKQQIFTNYDVLFKKYLSTNNVVKLSSESNTINSHWMYCIILKNIASYTDFEKYMEFKNIQIRPFFYDIHRHAHLVNIKKTTDIMCHANTGVMFPSYPELTPNQQEYIALCIKDYYSMGKT